LRINSNDIALKVNLFEQSVCELQKVVLRGESSSMRITVRLKEVKKRKALRGKQRVELLMNSVGKRKVVLLNPSFFYFFNPFLVSVNALHSARGREYRAWGTLLRDGGERVDEGTMRKSLLAVNRLGLDLWIEMKTIPYSILKEKARISFCRPD
jgi:hypothetical protein